MRQRKTRLIGHVRRFPHFPQNTKATSANGEKRTIQTLTIAARKNSPSTNIEPIVTEEDAVDEKTEQNVVSEIWKNRLATTLPLKEKSVEHNKVNLLRKGKKTGKAEQRIGTGKKHKPKPGRRISVRGFKRVVVLQNMKTAAMLFVVAIVYIIALIPAMLMAIGVIAIYLPIFYMYYVNNAINPIIYCFMNPAFREDVQNFFLTRFRNLQKVH